MGQLDQARKVVFPCGAEAATVNGEWCFVAPLSWPADSIALEMAIDGASRSGDCVTIECAPWENFLSKRLLSVKIEHPAKLRLEFGGRVTMFKRNGKEWLMAPGGPVDGEAMDDFLHCLSLLTFCGMATAEMFPSPSEKPHLAITIDGDLPGQRERLEFFPRGFEAAVRIDGELPFKMHSSALFPLISAAVNLKAKKVFYGLPGERILWRDGDAVTVIRRSAVDGSAIANGFGPTMSYSREVVGEKIFSDILALQWSEVVAEDVSAGEISMYGLQKPRRELEVDGKSLLLGPSFGDRIYCLDVKWNTVVAIPADEIENLAEKIAALAADY
jgi:hypothetical protein